MSDTIMDKNVHKEVSSKVREHLCSVLGVNTVKSIEYYICRGTSVEYAYSDAARLHDGLKRLFGDASNILIKEIIDMLCAEYGLYVSDANLEHVIKLIIDKGK